jgi:hypothetical protein
MGDTVGLSVVVPAFNEDEVLPELHRRLCAVLDATGGLRRGRLRQ